MLGALGAIITLVAAVMFYFGWRRSDAQARSMSIDVSLFGFSSQDYVLRSISSLYVPLLVILGLLLVWVWCHVALTHRLSSGWLDQNSRRSVLATSARAVMVAGVVLSAASLIFSALAGRDSAPSPVNRVADVLAPREWIVPLVLAVSTLVAVYAAWLRRQLVGQFRQGTSRLWTAVLPPILAVAMVALAGFWLLEEYAAAVGRDYAEDVAAGVDHLPRAVVTSATRWACRHPGSSSSPYPRLEAPSGTARPACGSSPARAARCSSCTTAGRPRPGRSSSSPTPTPWHGSSSADLRNWVDSCDRS